MKLTKIHLSGIAGKKFGRNHEFYVANVAQAIHALCAMIPGFRQFLQNAHNYGLQFAVYSGKRNLRKDQLEDPNGGDVITIVPIIQGAKRAGAGNVIMGAVMVVIGVIMLYTPAAAYGPAVIKFGVSMMIGGIVQMLAPPVKGLSASENPDNQPSYTFNGIKNTTAQGHPVPVAYGEGWAGSATISAGVYAQDQI